MMASMTTKTPMSVGDVLLALAERCEKATGADRQLDREIIAIMRPIIDPRDEFVVPYPGFTASLDAAISLVPEGCGWLAGYGRTQPDEPMGGAIITRHAATGSPADANDPIAEAEAATPALALCAAALRARSAAEAGNG